MAGTVVRFKTPYQSLAPETLFNVDQATKTLRPYGSGDAFLEGGFKFGQEQLADPSQFGGFSLGPIIDARAKALGQVNTDLNAFQNDTFAAEQPAAKRKSSSLADSVALETQNLNDAMTEFKTLKEKLTGLSAPNYQAAYGDLRTEAGIPGLEQDFLGVRQNRRELPYTERAATGNAAVATESQLQQQTAQKDIPLEAREANLIDRLQLASDFVSNSMRLKELDVNSARQGIADAINLVGEVINMSRTNLSELRTQKDKDQARADAALEFRLANDIKTPFFNSGGTIYDAGSLEGIPDEATFQQKYGMTLQDVEAKGLVGKLDGGVLQEKALILDLASNYPDAGIFPGDTLAQAQSKVGGSRIYRESVRPPASAGGGGGGILGLSNQQIDNISPLVTQFQNSPIVQNYNVIGEGYKFTQSLKNDTTNPLDDQALIYAFAKAMDPGSVVREGEYATVQKYAQSWASAYGKSVNQAISGTGFLTTTARTNIKDTIESRFKAAETSYQNLYGETSRRINLIGGTDKGDQLLNNYGGAFAPSSKQAGDQSIDDEIAALTKSGVIDDSQQKQKQSAPIGEFFKKAFNFVFK